MSTLTYADRDIVSTGAAETKPARKPFWARLYAASRSDSSSVIPTAPR